MTTRLQGIETEYGLALVPPPAHATREECAGELILNLARRVACLPALPGNGFFLGNGARAYIDVGSHPEYCTPEVGSPFEAVRCALAGDLLLLEAAAEWSAARPDPPQILLFKSNVDYLTGTTWASHESYSHGMDPRHLPRQLIPHLISRIVYCGAGGLNPAPDLLELCLSPRAHHLVAEVSPDSTGNRGIFHTRDESLAGDGWHRLHVLAGESLCSHRASVLRLGTTAIVLALIEAGLKPGDDVQPVVPLEALRTFNQDLSCRATVPMVHGARLSALEIQSRYLDLAEAHLDHGLMPGWAPQLCRLWRETLEQLGQDPRLASSSLDWPLKRVLFEDHLGKRGLSPERIDDWNRAVRAAPPHSGEAPASLRRIRRELAEIVQRLERTRPPEPPPMPAGFTPDQAHPFRQARAELAELEIRFTRLGDGSLFHALERTGLLHHRLPDQVSDAGIRAAMADPPEQGRARVRGRTIRELAVLRRDCAADWNIIRDRSGQFLDLSDPLLDHAPSWQPANEES